MGDSLRSRRIAVCTVALGLAACKSSDNNTTLTSAAACSKLANMSVAAAAIALPTGGATVTSATFESADGGASEYCKVEGAIHPVDPSAPDIHFELNLPSRWNGKVVHYGGGGYDGTVVTGLDNVPQGLGATPLAQGYATFGSDSGHTGNVADGTFGLNDEALANFGGNQLKKTHDVALTLIAARYGSAPKRVYFAGGSQGGHEAFLVVQRWPQDYDGAAVHYPAYDFTALQLAGNRISKAIYAPGGWLNPNKVASLHTYVLGACDALDGVEDGIISHVSACDTAFHVEDHRCAGGKDTGDDCFSDPQIAALDTMNSALSLDFALAGGITGFPRWPIFVGGDLEGLSTFGTSSTPSKTPSFGTNGALYVLSTPAIRYFVTRDPNFDPMTFELEAWQPRLVALANEIDASSSDISAFEARGGKILLVHGTSDFLVSPYNTIDYYERLVRQFGQSRLDAFLQFYVLPGFGHNSGVFLASWDSLTALDNWVENGSAPTSLVATDANPQNKGRTRPMCKYPTWPKYTGSDPNAASSFTCVNP